MKKTVEFLWKALHPHPVVLALLTAGSAAGLVYVFLNDMSESVVAYVCYPIAFYTLCAIVLAIIPLVGRVRQGVYSNRYAARYLSEKELRARVALYKGTIINFTFALFKLAAGIWYRSIWFGAVAVYYMVLCAARVLLIRDDRMSARIECPEERLRHGWKSYRFCGWLMLLLNAAITGMTVQMVWQNKGYTYPGFVVYAVAAYTFYRIIMAIVRIAGKKPAENPVLDASIAMDLSAALVAIFTLQTAMFASFGMEMAADTRRLMNALTGSAVCVVVLVLAVFMLARAGKKLKKSKEKGER